MRNYGLEIVALAALIGGMALWGYAARLPAKRAPAAVTAKATPNKGYLKEDVLDGGDVAKALQLPLYKWKLRFPPGTKSLVFWVEDWRRGTPRPTIVGLFTRPVRPEATLASAEPTSLLIKLPDTRDDRYVVSLAGAATSAPLPGMVPVAADGITSTGSSGSRPVFLREDVLLAGTAQNAGGTVQATYDAESVARNTRTLLFKMHFSTSDSGVFPFFENGKVVVATL